MCLKNSRKYLQLNFCTQDKNLTHSMQGKEGKKKPTTKNKEWLLFCTTRINKIHAIHLHTLCKWLWTLSMRKNSTHFLPFFLFFFFKNWAGSLGSLLLLYCFAIIYYKFKTFYRSFFSYYGFQGFFFKNALWYMKALKLIRYAVKHLTAQTF